MLVTEGARGLGAAITRALLREGAHVVVNYRKSEMLAYALRDESGDRVLPIQADVTDAAAVARLFFLSPWARAVAGQNLIVGGGLVKG